MIHVLKGSKSLPIKCGHAPAYLAVITSENEAAAAIPLTPLSSLALFFDDGACRQPVGFAMPQQQPSSGNAFTAINNQSVTGHER